VDNEQEQAALAERLAARFARLHPETARRLRARAETYIHPPLVDPRPTAVVAVTPADATGVGQGTPATKGTRSW
jgi:hypothetical protein